MNRKQIFVLAGAFLALIILLLALKWVFRPASKTVQKEKPEFIFEASALVKEFETDEQTANTLYLDKIIEVSGTVDDITEDETVIIVTLKDPGSISGILCSFDKSTVASENFEKGEKIDVKGICTGYLMDVVLTKCAVTDE